MSKLYFCVGSARCGKSTYCNEWVKQAPNRVIVSGDDIRLALHGMRYSSLAEEMVSAIKYVTIRAQLARGAEVMVDGTHTTMSSAEKLLKIDNNATAIIFDTSEEECIRRAILTNQSDLIPVIKRHHRTLNEVNKFFGSYQDMMVVALEKIKAVESGPKIV